MDGHSDLREHRPTEQGSTEQGSTEQGLTEHGLTERRLRIGDGEIPYRYGVDCTPQLVQALAAEVADSDGVLLVVDRNATAHCGPLLDALDSVVRVEPYLLDATEQDKTLARVQSIMEFAVEHKLTRNTTVIAMGGGVVGNVAGLAAALLYRGIRLVHLPTTPVAAFDAVISMKQGVNLRFGKNLCGVYLSPSLILCDLRWLTSVPPGNLRTGLAEMAKNVLISVPSEEERFARAIAGLDDDPLDSLQTMIEIGIDGKAHFLHGDPREKGRAIIFEYGHTVGHAIEFTSAGRIDHGEAVAWGMLAAAEVGRVVTGLGEADVDAHRRMAALLGLPDPRERLATIDRDALWARLRSDNKRGYIACGPGEIPMVLLDGLGRPSRLDAPHPLVPVPEAVVEAALATVFSDQPQGAR